MSPNKDAFRELMLLKRVHIFLMIDYDSPYFPKICLSVEGAVKGDTASITNLELAYKVRGIRQFQPQI